MAFCEFCGEKIGYLPFKCKYCGGTFCKKHRLPENHQCSFELKHVPLVPADVKEIPVYDKRESKVAIQEEAIKAPKALKKYLKRQEREAKLIKKRAQPSVWGRSRIKGTKILVGLILGFSILGFILQSYGLGRYIFFDIYILINNYLFHTILTSLFIGQVFDPFGFFFFIIMIFFLFFISRSIELNYGTSFLIKLFLLSAIGSMLIYILLRLLLITIYPLDGYFFNFFYVGFAWGGILGLLASMIFPNANREITAFFYFLPIRMKGRTFLFIIVLIRLLPVLLFVYFDPGIVLYYIPDLGGVLFAYIIFKYDWGLT
ncbi:MAG: AN1-type zinc finger domain-containing protein [Promethearchaeota archaeon]